MEPKNILQVSAWFQKEAPSSKLNRTPPTGAPNAAATPAAAPPDIEQTVASLKALVKRRGILELEVGNMALEAAAQGGQRGSVKALVNLGVDLQLKANPSAFFWALVMTWKLWQKTRSK